MPFPSPRTAAFACLLIALAACDAEGPPAAKDAPVAATVAPTPAPALMASPWTLPAPDGAAQPDLAALDNGQVLLSWIEPRDGGGHALKFARWEADAWSEPREIARGDDWFVNWADTPHLRATPDGALWAHWLRKSAAAPYAYDVVLTRSADAGATWSTPLEVNDDGTPTEHGFVAMWPAARDRIGIAWLDGRKTGGGHEGHAQGHDAGAMAMMTLRTAHFDAALARSDETEVDASTCDCCQTDAALTERGPLLVYRDRTEAEIRDVYTTRWQAGAWTPARAVHADGWRMPACPVNGPAVAARGAQAVVGWYTAAGGPANPAAQGEPTLWLAASPNAGDAFAKPVLVDSGAHVQGRIDVALDASAATALWLREGPDGQSLWLGRWTPDLARELQRIEVARIQGKGRGTGFPKLAQHAAGTYAVWTELVDGTPRLRGARLQPGPAEPPAAAVVVN
ncbi:MAG: glycoside hydrolase [Pseudomonas sp.]|nr:glycoside hydrolase [Pseudomonas sp.]